MICLELWPKYIVVAYMVMAYIVVACMVITYIVMAHMLMGYRVMVRSQYAWMICFTAWCMAWFHKASFFDGSKN